MTDEEDERQRRQRMRSLAIAWALAALAILFFVVTMVIGVIMGVIWELRTKDPIVDFRMLKNRNFAIATTAMFFLGFVLYSSTVLIPQLLQQLLGYPAELAGLARL